MAPRKSYLLRIPPALFDDLERWASDELHSVNAQIEFVLTDAIRRAGRRRARPSSFTANTEESDE